MWTFVHDINSKKNMLINDVSGQTYDVENPVDFSKLLKELIDEFYR